MWGRHKREIAMCFLFPVVIVLILFILVTLCEYYRIHVAGSREMWIGLIGTLLGGMCTLIGVLITLFKQEDSEEERRRLDNQPIIGFELLPYTDGLEEREDVDSLITCYTGEMVTSAFVALESKKFSIIKISTLTKPVFNFVVENVWINGEKVPKGKCFNPLKCRIAPGEMLNMVFDYTEEGDKHLNSSLFCVIRFSYDDIFGNHYYQDLPITYDETTYYKGDEGCIRQIVSIQDIQAPQYITDRREKKDKKLIAKKVFMKGSSMKSTKYDELVKGLNFKDAHAFATEIRKRINTVVSDSSNPLSTLEELICYIEGYQNRTYHYTYTSVVYGLLVGLITLLSATNNCNVAISVIMILVCVLICYLLKRMYGSEKKEQMRGFVLAALKFKYDKLKWEINNSDMNVQARTLDCNQDEVS